MRVGFLIAMLASEDTNQGETFRSAKVDLSLPFWAAAMLEETESIVEGVVVVVDVDLALIREMDG